MTLLTGPGEGPSLPHAGRPMHVLAGYDDRPAGFAAAELAVPPHFTGPIPHAHAEFDEAIYVLSGRLQVLVDQRREKRSWGRCSSPPAGTATGSATRTRNQHGSSASGSPAAPALAFMQDVGTVLTADGPPDPGRMRDIYAAHASRLLP